MHRCSRSHGARPPSVGGPPPAPRPRAALLGAEGRPTQRSWRMGRGRFSLAVSRQQVSWKDLEGSGRPPPHPLALDTDWNDPLWMPTPGLRPRGRKQVSTGAGVCLGGPSPLLRLLNPQRRWTRWAPNPLPCRPLPEVLGAAETPPRGTGRHRGGFWAPRATCSSRLWVTYSRAVPRLQARCAYTWVSV